MKQLSKFAFCLAGLFSMAQAAHADGLYVTASVGRTTLDNMKSDLDSTFRLGGLSVQNSSASDGTALSGGIGYQINEMFAVEASYLDTGTFKYRATVAGTPTSLDVSASTLHLAGLAFLPVGERFSLYGKVGYTSGNLGGDVKVGGQTFKFEGTTDDSVGYGVGVRFKVSDKISIRGGYDRYFADVGGFTVSTQIFF
jgi:outer membrane autotransporter protein